MPRRFTLNNWNTSETGLRFKFAFFNSHNGGEFSFLDYDFLWQVNPYSCSRIGGILHLAGGKEVKGKTEELEPVGLRGRDQCAALPPLVPVSSKSVAAVPPTPAPVMRQ